MEGGPNDAKESLEEVEAFVEVFLKNVEMDKYRKGWQNMRIKKAFKDIKEGKTYINLYSCGLSDDDCIAVGKYLKEYGEGVEHLDLENNNTGDDGCKWIAPAIASLTSLKLLNLRGNNIGDDGCKWLGPAVASSTSLTELNLSENKIKDDGCESIAPAIASSKSLTKLEIYQNYITVKGKLTLANVLKLRDTYIYIDCYIQYIDDNGSQSKDFEVDESDVKMEPDAFASGNFGCAYFAKYKDEEGYVVKIGFVSNEKEAQYEAILLSCIPTHENLLEITGACTDLVVDGRECRGLVMKRYDGGSFLSFVKETKGNISMEDRLSFFFQISSVIKHLHEYNMIHRDISCRNFVLTGDKKKIVIIDFGCSFILTEGRNYFPSRGNDILPYRIQPPESLCSPYNYYLKSDIYQLGICFWESFYIRKGEAFFFCDSPQSQREFILKIMFENMESIPLMFDDSIPSEMKNLITWCCDFDFEKRPSAKQVNDVITKMVEGLTIASSNKDGSNHGDAISLSLPQSDEKEDEYPDFVPNPQVYSELEPVEQETSALANTASDNNSSDTKVILEEKSSKIDISRDDDLDVPDPDEYSSLPPNEKDPEHYRLWRDNDITEKDESNPFAQTYGEDYYISWCSDDDKKGKQFDQYLKEYRERK